MSTVRIKPLPGWRYRVMPDRRTSIYSHFLASHGDVSELGLKEVELEVEVDEWGVASCTELKIRALEGESVTWQTLRSLPVDRLLRRAKAKAGSLLVQEAPGRFILPSVEERAAIHHDLAKVARRPRQGSPMTAEHLREVAEAYRAALDEGRPPRQAICRRWHVEPPTASRWIAKARAEGLLGPALRGQAGEQS